MGIGNKPIDDGDYLFTATKTAEFLEKQPSAETYFTRWYGSIEFINGIERWVFWLGEAPPAELTSLPEALKRVQSVRENRLKSRSAPT